MIVSEVAKDLESGLWSLDVDVSCLLVLLHLLDGAIHEVGDLMGEEVTLHKDVAVAFWHHVQTLVGLAADGAHWSLLNHILQGHAVENTERKLDAELEALVGITVLHGSIQDGWCIAEEVGVVLRHGSTVLQVVEGALAESAAICELCANLSYLFVLLLYFIEVVVDSHPVLQPLVPRIVHEVLLHVIICIEVVFLVLKALVDTVAVHVVLAAEAVLQVNLVSTGVDLFFLLLPGLHQLFVIHVGF